MKFGLINHIENSIDKCSDKEKLLGEYILKNSSMIPYMTTKELAKSAGASEAGIIRFCKKIGIKSYREFKLALVKELTIEMKSINQVSEKNNNITQYDILNNIINLNKSAVEDIRHTLDNKEMDKAIEIISNCEKIAIYGVGGSAVAAMDAFHKFNKLGITAFSMVDFHMLLPVISNFKEDDILMVISASGNTKEIVEIINFAKKKNIKVIAITSLSNSSVYKLSDINLCIPFLENDFRVGSIASRISQLTIIDIIYLRVFNNIKDSVVENFYEIREEVVKYKRNS